MTRLNDQGFFTDHDIIPVFRNDETDRVDSPGAAKA